MERKQTTQRNEIFSSSFSSFSSVPVSFTSSFSSSSSTSHSSYVENSAFSSLSFPLVVASTSISDAIKEEEAKTTKSIENFFKVFTEFCTQIHEDSRYLVELSMQPIISNIPSSSSSASSVENIKKKENIVNNSKCKNIYSKNSNNNEIDDINKNKNEEENSDENNNAISLPLIKIKAKCEEAKKLTKQLMILQEKLRSDIPLKTLVLIVKKLHIYNESKIVELSSILQNMGIDLPQRQDPMIIDEKSLSNVAIKTSFSPNGMLLSSLSSTLANNNTYTKIKEQKINSEIFSSSCGLYPYSSLPLSNLTLRNIADYSSSYINNNNTNFSFLNSSNFNDIKGFGGGGGLNKENDSWKETNFKYTKGAEIPGKEEPREININTNRSNTKNNNNYKYNNYYLANDNNKSYKSLNSTYNSVHSINYNNNNNNVNNIRNNNINNITTTYSNNNISNMINNNINNCNNMKNINISNMNNINNNNNNNMNCSLNQSIAFSQNQQSNIINEDFNSKIPLHNILPYFASTSSSFPYSSSHITQTTIKGVSENIVEGFIKNNNANSNNINNIYDENCNVKNYMNFNSISVLNEDELNNFTKKLNIRGDVKLEDMGFSEETKAILNLSNNDYKNNDDENVINNQNKNTKK